MVSSIHAVEKIRYTDACLFRSFCIRYLSILVFYLGFLSWFLADDFCMLHINYLKNIEI